MKIAFFLISLVVTSPIFAEGNAEAYQPTWTLSSDGPKSASNVTLKPAAELNSPCSATGVLVIDQTDRPAAFRNFFALEISDDDGCSGLPSRQWFTRDAITWIDQCGTRLYKTYFSQGSKATYLLRVIDNRANTCTHSRPEFEVIIYPLDANGNPEAPTIKWEGKDDLDAPGGSGAHA